MDELHEARRLYDQIHTEVKSLRRRVAASVDQLEAADAKIVHLSSVIIDQRARIIELEEQVEDLSIRFIEARNPGIDPETVRALRAQQSSYEAVGLDSPPAEPQPGEHTP